MVHHCLGYIKVGDYSVLHWSYRYYITRGSPYHLLGFCTNCKDLLTVSVNGHYGRFDEYYALTAHMNQGICCAKIHTDIPSNIVVKPLHLLPLPSQSKTRLVPTM